MSENKKFFSLLFILVFSGLYYFYSSFLNGMKNNLYGDDYSVLLIEVLMNSLDESYFNSIKKIHSANDYCIYEAFLLKECVGVVLSSDLIENKEIYGLIIKIVENPCKYISVRSNQNTSFRIRDINYPYTRFYCTDNDNDNDKEKLNVGFFVIEDEFGLFDFKVDLKKEH